MRVLGIDQGTTATKGMVLDGDGRLMPVFTAEHAQIRRRPGWVEHDAGELLRNLEACIAAAGPVDAVGIANQGESVVAWDAATGAPVCDVIVWQDTRTGPAIERLRAEGVEALTRARAGLPLDPYFSAAKLAWILAQVPEARGLRRADRLRLGTLDSFFLDRLAGRYVTDVTTASRTSLLDLDRCCWDADLCRAFDVPAELLAPIVPTTGPLGAIRIAGRDVPVAASIVDQQAALFGHGCRRPGATKITFGTGAFLLALAGERRPEVADTGLLPTVAWQLDGAAPVYALDGGLHAAAAAVNWLRGTGLIDSLAEIDAFDGPSAIERGLAFVPAFTGLACPYWDRTAAAAWLGIGLDTTRADLCRAVLEGVALRTAQLVAAVERLLPPAPELSIDGGLAGNRYFCRFLAAALGRTVRVPGGGQMTALGTAQLAAVGAGLATPDTLPPLPPVRAAWPCAEPLPAALHRRFADAVARTRGWR